MEEYKIKLNTIEEVKDFANITKKFNFHIELISGRYVVDAKSILGIFSLDLTKELTLKPYKANEDELNEFYHEVYKYKA